MPMIQIDLQRLSNEQRTELRSRVVAAVSSAIGSPYPYVSVVIREADPSNIVEAGGWGPYDRRELIPEAHGDVLTVEVVPPTDGVVEERGHG
jgi:phenylpyruvate tautomerase PptA (4-oxalocrotonate tautomerase family)